MHKTSRGGNNNGVGRRTSRRITTSLYDVVAAVNETVSPRERRLVPLIVEDILVNGRAHPAAGHCGDARERHARRL